jgi:Rha family phage regulatory protein
MKIPLAIPQDAIFFQHNQLKTNSFKVAEAFGKQHKHVTEKLRSIQCSEQFLTANFSAVKFSHRGNEYDAWEMTKDGFMFIVMSFTGKKAAMIKEAYINAFNAMAEQLAKPKTQPLGELPITPAQLYHLKTAARTLAERSGEPVLDVYEDVMRVFGVNDLREITVDYYPQVCAMLQTDALEGEWLRGQMPPLPMAPRYHYPKNSAKPIKSQLPNQSWLTPEVLLDPSYPRPINALLTQLHRDGHDVAGANIEYMALRDHLMEILKTFNYLLNHGHNMVWNR